MDRKLFILLWLQWLDLVWLRGTRNNDTWNILSVNIVKLSFSYNDYFDVDLHYIRDDEHIDLDLLDICCSWSKAISDGVLTYTLVETVEIDDSTRQAVKDAVEEWDSNIEGLELWAHSQGRRWQFITYRSTVSIVAQISNMTYQPIKMVTKDLENRDDSTEWTNENLMIAIVIKRNILRK